MKKANPISQAETSGESGQALTEAVLLIVIFLTLIIQLSSFFVKKQLLAQVVSAPWSYVSNMIQFGVWNSDPQAAAMQHPNIRARHLSMKGTQPGGQ